MQQNSNMKVFSIFISFSGEVGGIPQGTPATFLRLGGCNLRCSYCDAKDSLKSKNFTEISAKDLAKLFNDTMTYWPRNLFITGGEPLIQQDNLVRLFIELERRGLNAFDSITIETNGTRSPLPALWRTGLAISKNIHFIVDIKCPSNSGIDPRVSLPAETLYEVFSKGHSPRISSMYKAVVSSYHDFMYAVHKIAAIRNFAIRRDSENIVAAILKAYQQMPLAVSPTAGLDPEELWEWIVHDRSGIILNKQIHKDIFSEGEVGDVSISAI